MKHESLSAPAGANQLGARISAARASVGRTGNTVAERVRSGAEASDQFVRDQPWRVVGISAIAGLLVGFMLGRRGS